VVLSIGRRLPILYCSLKTMPTDLNSLIELLTIAEVAEQLKISVSGVRRLQQARQLPFIKVGGSIRFFKSDIFAYLKKQRTGSIG
jgi:excisionase family DNA binding protein